MLIARYISLSEPEVLDLFSLPPPLSVSRQIILLNVSLSAVKLYSPECWQSTHRCPFWRGFFTCRQHGMLHTESMFSFPSNELLTLRYLRFLPYLTRNEILILNKPLKQPCMVCTSSMSVLITTWDPYRRILLNYCFVDISYPLNDINVYVLTIASCLLWFKK